MKKSSLLVSCLYGLLVVSLALSNLACSPMQSLTPSQDSVPLDVGYLSSTLSESAAPKIATTKTEAIQALNAHLLALHRECTLLIDPYRADLLPDSIDELERYFARKIEFGAPVYGKKNPHVAQISVNIHYDEVGNVLRDGIEKNDYPSDSKEKKLAHAAAVLLAGAKGKSEYEQIQFLYESIIKQTNFDTGAYNDGEYCTAYDVLVRKKGNDESMSEAMQFLLTLLGIENRVVLANTNSPSGSRHLFNKIKMDGQWYNVDLLLGKSFPTPGIRYVYFMVDDALVNQRYRWEEKRYPSSPQSKEYHKEHGLEVRSQAELETLVKKAVRQRQKQLVCWIADYSSTKYKTGFIHDLPEIDKASVSFIDGLGEMRSAKTVATELLFILEYK